MSRFLIQAAVSFFTVITINAGYNSNMNPLQAFFDAILAFLQTLVHLLAGFFDAIISLIQAMLNALTSLL